MIPDVENGTESFLDTASPVERHDPEERKITSKVRSCGLWFKSQVGWIPQNWTRSKIETTIRCAIVGWISAVLFVIPSVQIFLGQVSVFFLLSISKYNVFMQASFLILIGTSTSIF